MEWEDIVTKSITSNAEKNILIKFDEGKTAWNYLRDVYSATSEQQAHLQVGDRGIHSFSLNIPSSYFLVFAAVEEEPSALIKMMRGKITSEDTTTFEVKFDNELTRNVVRTFVFQIERLQDSSK